MGRTAKLKYSREQLEEAKKYMQSATQGLVRLIGNAVSPPQAAALVKACFPGGVESERGVA